jgi:spore germination cell wall hydrolase CwlJ-like protein
MRVSARGGTSPSRVFCILSPARKATRVNSSGSQGALVAEDTGTVTLFAHLRAPERARSLIQTLKNGMSRQRASVAAVVLGGVVGAAVGMAYLGGAVAQSATVRGQAYRMAGAYDSGFTDEAVAAAVGGLDASALEIARRHDPYTVAGDAQRDRRSAQLTALLERRGQAALTRASTSATADAGLRGGTTVNPARPFRLNGALESSRDLDCLTTAVYYEARGEGQAGMQAVAQVVLNRARHGAFPQTVCGVVYQGAGRRTGCQFSFVCNGSMRGRREGGAWERARRVAANALSGHVYAPVGNATHFHTTAVNPRWSGSLVRITQVGSHIFYRFGGRRGRPSQFAESVQPSGDMARADAGRTDGQAPDISDVAVNVAGAIPQIDGSVAAAERSTPASAQPAA